MDEPSAGMSCIKREKVCNILYEIIQRHDVDIRLRFKVLCFAYFTLTLLC